MLLKQPALQAAIAAQMSAHKQPRAPQQSTAAGDTATPSTSSDVPAASSSQAPTQELSVAQMMMTLAQASNKNSQLSEFPPNN